MFPAAQRGILNCLFVVTVKIDSLLSHETKYTCNSSQLRGINKQCDYRYAIFVKLHVVLHYIQCQ